MGANMRYPSGPHPTPPERSDTLEQVEPEYGAEFTTRPFSLTAEELGRMPATMATDPIPVLAWVRFPVMPVHLQGRALAWPPTPSMLSGRTAGCTAPGCGPRPSNAVDWQLEPRAASSRDARQPMRFSASHEPWVWTMSLSETKTYDQCSPRA